jgi:hypothetical protein
MLGRFFPPMPSPVEVVRQAIALSGSAEDNTPGQHVISKVILKQFAEPEPKTGALKVYSFDIEYPNAKNRCKGLTTCGQAPKTDFVRFASRSVEQKWKAVEDRLPETLFAIEQGTVFDDIAHLARIRDLVALHFIRSIQSDVIRWRTWNDVYAACQQRWRDDPAALDRVSRMRPGFYTAGETGRETTLNDLHAQTVELMESGAYFRVLVEDRFERMCTWVQDAEVEILTSEQGEFLIGDIPVLLMSPGYIGSGVLDDIGLLAADHLVLPLGPRYLAKLGGRNQFTRIPAETVNTLNIAQVKAAFTHVFFRPDSVLEEFVKSVDRPKPSDGPLGDAYTRYKKKE